MKNILLYSVLCLLMVHCSANKTSFVSATGNYKNTYNSYLETGETKIFSWYQGVTSQNDNEEYLVRLFYPEKKQITSLVTYKIYSKDTKHGLSKKWADNGALTSEGNYENNARDGVWRFYSNITGLLSSEGKYEDGETQGKWKNYASNGKISNEISWIAGVKDGPFVEYDTLGAIINEGIYKADTIFEQTKEEEVPRMYANGTIFVIVEEMPYLKECEHIKDLVERKKKSDELLLKYIYENVKYPTFARENAVEGLAVLSFTVMENGTIQDVSAIYGICESIEKECRRIIHNMPQWSPGKQKGEAVRVKYNLPIRFKLT